MSKTPQPPAPKWIVYFSLSVSITALCVSLLFFLKKENIVYVDSLKLLSQYKGSLAAKAEYDKKVAVWKANIDTLTNEVTNEITKYQKDKVKLTAREKKLTEELIASKQQQLENYKTAISQNASKEDQEVTSRVFKEISEFVKRYGERHGYDYVMGATNMGNIVYARTGKNITDEVIKELNAEYQKGKK
jgi:outer membrane protein